MELITTTGMIKPFGIQASAIRSANSSPPSCRNTLSLGNLGISGMGSKDFNMNGSRQRGYVSNAGGRIRVGACGSSHFGQGLAVNLSKGNGARWTASTWLDNSAQVEVDVPLPEAWALWSNQENVVNWMPWIASVKVLDDKPNMSKWTLRYSAFGQNFEFSWLARNLKPIHHQKIHWRSVDGLANRGAVRFYPRSPSSCGVQLTISYEVPDVLAPFATGIVPLVESILKQDLERFAKYAKQQSINTNVSRT